MQKPLLSTGRTPFTSRSVQHRLHGTTFLASPTTQPPHQSTPHQYQIATAPSSSHTASTSLLCSVDPYVSPGPRLLEAVRSHALQEVTVVLQGSSTPPVKWSVSQAGRQAGRQADMSVREGDGATTAPTRVRTLTPVAHVMQRADPKACVQSHRGVRVSTSLRPVESIDNMFCLFFSERRTSRPPRSQGVHGCSCDSELSQRQSPRAVRGGTCAGPTGGTQVVQGRSMMLTLVHTGPRPSTQSRVAATNRGTAWSCVCGATHARQGIQLACPGLAVCVSVCALPEVPPSAHHDGRGVVDVGALVLPGGRAGRDALDVARGVQAHGGRGAEAGVEREARLVQQRPLPACGGARWGGEGSREVGLTTGRPCRGGRGRD
jgi:hypothetical protein